ncbi:MAG TPA: glucokinase [Desulfarculaceae bacterium]|nr:glucokinase [Desulfarculaceae bacterium]
MNSYIMAADIGATKTNIGIFQPQAEELERVAVRSFKSCAEDEFIDRIKEFAAVEMGQGGLLATCFGVAGPVVNGRVVATNLGLELDEKTLQRELSCPSLKLVNDLVATAAALPVLENSDVVSLQTVHTSKVTNQEETIAILAPGTGLGMAFLVDGRQLKILSSEGGHADFAPRDEEEVELWRYLKRRFGRVSRERVISGPGLVNIFDWLRERQTDKSSDAVSLPVSLPGKISGADVVLAAVAGDLMAGKSLEFFTSILGGVAGDLVLTGMASGGLYLAGGIPAKIIDFLGRGQFLTAFNAKGRMSAWLEQVPVKVVLNPEAALIGAARIARQQIPTTY